MVLISTNGTFARKSATHRERKKESSIPSWLMRIVLIFFLRKVLLRKSSSTAAAATQRVLGISYGVMKAVMVK